MDEGGEVGEGVTGVGKQWLSSREAPVSLPVPLSVPAPAPVPVSVSVSVSVSSFDTDAIGQVLEAFPAERLPAWQVPSPIRVLQGKLPRTFTGKLRRCQHLC